MEKYVMVAQSRAKPGREAEYVQWYDTCHLKEVCAVPGIKSGHRFDALPEFVGQPGTPYLAIYEIESDDPSAVLAELNRRFAAGEMHMTDSLDMASANLWLYKQS